MKQNKGISQIAVMVIMLVLAIALPITTKLVQKSQENRSKAAGGLGYAEVCKLDSDCKPPTGQTSGFCTNTTQHTTNWPSFSKGDAPPVCSYGWGNKDEQRRNEACFLVGGSCSEPYSASWGNNCKTDKGVDGVVVWNLCLANPYLGTARCCVPDTVYAQLGDANKTTVTSKPSDLLACKKGSVVWVDGQATDGIYNWKCVGYEGKVSVEGSANKTACVPNTKECLDADTARVCKSDGSGWINSECGTAGCNSTTKICNTVAPTATPTIKPTATPTIKPTATPTIKPTGTITPTPTPTLTPTPVLVCAVGDKQCSGNILQKCNSTGTGWETDVNCGELGCNSVTKTCNECVSGQQKCSTDDNYFTCVNGKWSTTTTDCIGDEVCTNNNVANDVCVEPDYIAPKLTMHVSMLGIGGKNIQTQCLGDTITLRVNVAKFNAAEGDRGITRQVTATKVNDKFSTVKIAGDGYQVYEIKDFALDTTYLPSDKIFVNVTSLNNGELKLLATLYGKNNQTGGYAAQNGSQLLISALSNPLSFYNYPILNGDIGSDNNNTLGDGVLNGSDFGHIKNQWGKSVDSGQTPLRADLNGDCVVDSLDFQIYKKSSEEQYASKEF